MSGDAKQTVERVGKFLSIPNERLIGEVDAENKKNILKRIKEEHHSEVMMIGDGLNDILSIQEASIGVSINAKSELNLLASDMVALNENLWKIVSMFQLIKKARLFIIINLCWAFVYNIFMIPVSAGAFYPLGIEVSPIVASVAMSASSLVVVLFSNIMRCLPYDPSLTTKWKNFTNENKITLIDETSRSQIMAKKNPSFFVSINSE